MPDPVLPPHPSQVIVIVTIVGVDEKSQAFYTYTDNNSGIISLENRQSIVRAVIPYHTIYVLDYASSRNGWLFRRSITKVSGPDTEHHRADNKLAMVTVHNDNVEHRFKLRFRNVVTDCRFDDDPQEANIKQPS